MKRWVLSILFALLIFSGLGLSIFFGLTPRPVPKIKLSGVATAEGFADAVFRRLSNELFASNTLILGVSPMEPHRQLAMALANRFLKDHSNTTIWMDPLLSELFNELFNNSSSERTHLSFLSEKTSSIHPIDFRSQSDLILKNMHPEQANLILVPHVFATQTIPGGPGPRFRASALTQTPKARLLSLSIAFLPLNREEESQLDPPCAVANHDTYGTGNFGCMALQLARPTYHKERPKDTHLGLMSQTGENDFLILFR